MYILKISGSLSIPDYIQIRDHNFLLVAYFRSGNSNRALSKCGLQDRQNEILDLVGSLPYGKIHKLIF